MDQSTEKKLEEKNKILDFYKNHKTKIYFMVFILLTVIISFTFFNYKNNKNNIIIAEKYVEAGLYLASNKNNKAKIIYEEIILSKNKFQIFIKCFSSHLNDQSSVNKLQTIHSPKSQNPQTSNPPTR